MKLKAFIVGMWEFRSSVTSRFDDCEMAYEWGRELAHRLTFRRFEQ